MGIAYPGNTRQNVTRITFLQPSADLPPAATAGISLGCGAGGSTALSFSIAGVEVASVGGSGITVGAVAALGGGTINVASGYLVNNVPISLAAFKSASTSRSNNTFSADPHLSLFVPAAGTYSYRMLLPMSGGIGGFAMGVQFTGTCTNSYSIASGFQNSAAKTFGYSANLLSGASMFSSASVAVGDWLLVEGTFTCSTTGTLDLQWAQNTTNAAATILQQGAYLTIVPV
jgi:hypothetical protein